MIRFFFSAAIGAALGLLIGLYIGWEVAPVEFVDSPLPELSRTYRDEYTIMVASGYLVDRDINGAIERLRRLGEENVPEYVQATAERYITNSREVDDIRKLVTLAEGLGRLTPPMEQFRQLPTTGGTP